MDDKWEPKFGDVTNFGIVETLYPDGSIGLVTPGAHAVVSRGLLVRIPHPLEQRVKELEETLSYAAKELEYSGLHHDHPCLVKLYKVLERHNERGGDL